MSQPITVEKYAVGQSVRRVEDVRLLQGLGRYSDDVRLPRQATAAIVRSTHAHARIVRVDAAAAAGGARACSRCGPKPTWPPTGSAISLPMPAASGPAARRRSPRRVPRWLAGGSATSAIPWSWWSRRPESRRPTPRRWSTSSTSRCPRWPRRPMPGARARRRSGTRPLTISRSSGKPAPATPSIAPSPAAAHVTRLDFTITRVAVAPLEPRAAVGEYDRRTGPLHAAHGHPGPARQPRHPRGHPACAAEPRARGDGRGRRQLRHAQRHVPGDGAGAVGGEAAGAARRMDVRPPRGLRHRRARPRQRLDGRAGAGRRRPIPRRCAWPSG